MRTISPKKLVLIGGVLLTIIMVSVITLLGIGRAYQMGLSRFSGDQTSENATHVIREKITRIKLRRSNDSGCIEITPDGAVRVFSVCDAQLTDARRQDDTRDILRLFKQLSEIDLTNIKDSKESDLCDTYKVTLQYGLTEKTICLSDIAQSNGFGHSSGVGNQIINNIITTIEQIVTNIPTPTATLIPPTPTSIIAVVPSVTATVSPLQSITPGPSPTPGPTGEPDKPFTCDFYDTESGKKPYTVSGVICSTTPQPGQ